MLGCKHSLACCADDTVSQVRITGVPHFARFAAHLMLLLRDSNMIPTGEVENEEALENIEAQVSDVLQGYVSYLISAPFLVCVSIALHHPLPDKQSPYSD